jgi:hypothetical protein
VTREGRRTSAVATGQADARQRSRSSSRDQSGILLQPGPDAFTGAPNDLERELERVVLQVGDPVWVTGPTAAALHGFDGFELSRPFHLLVPSGRTLDHQSVIVHVSDRLDWCDLGVRDGFPVTRPARTVVDLARVLDGTPLRAAVDAAAATGLLNEHVLHRRLVTLAAEPGADQLYDVIEQRDRESGAVWLAAEFLRLMECHGISRPTADIATDPATGRFVRAEFAWSPGGVVAVVLGWKAPFAPERLDALGCPLVFSLDQLVLHPRHVVTTCKLALQGLPQHTRPCWAGVLRQTGEGAAR